MANAALGVRCVLQAIPESILSNYGEAVDIFVPGVQIISAWNGGSGAVATAPDTSVAAVHAASLVAHLMSRDGNVSPADTATKLVAAGVPVVKRIRT